jgi:hypothetical protein
MNPVTITFTQDQLKVLNDALIELPFRIAAPLIQYINTQIQKQFDSRIEGPTGAIPIQQADNSPNNL